MIITNELIEKYCVAIPISDDCRDILSSTCTMAIKEIFEYAIEDGIDCPECNKPLKIVDVTLEELRRMLEDD